MFSIPNWVIVVVVSLICLQVCIVCLWAVPGYRYLKRETSTFDTDEHILFGASEIRVTEKTPLRYTRRRSRVTITNKKIVELSQNLERLIILEGIMPLRYRSLLCRSSSWNDISVEEKEDVVVIKVRTGVLKLTNVAFEIPAGVWNSNGALLS